MSHLFVEFYSLVRPIVLASQCSVMVKRRWRYLKNSVRASTWKYNDGKSVKWRSSTARVDGEAQATIWNHRRSRELASLIAETAAAEMNQFKTYCILERPNTLYLALNAAVRYINSYNSEQSHGNSHRNPRRRETKREKTILERMILRGGKHTFYTLRNTASEKIHAHCSSWLR